MKSIVITTLGNSRLTVYPVGTVTVQQHATTCTIEIYNPGGKLLYECKEAAEEINAMLAFSACNPTEADISRRVGLLIELEPVCAQTEDPEGVRAQLRCVAIRQLLAERGGK